MAWYLIGVAKGNRFQRKVAPQGVLVLPALQRHRHDLSGLFAFAFSGQGKPAMDPIRLDVHLRICGLCSRPGRHHPAASRHWKKRLVVLHCLCSVVGGLILFVLTLLDSDPERNEYGPNPKVSGHANVVI